MKNIAEDSKSPYLLIQDALYDRKKFIDALKVIQKFCIMHKVQIELSTNHLFISKGNPSPQSEFIVNSLNALDINYNFFDIKFFLNNEKKVNLQKICNNLCVPNNNDKSIIKSSEFNMQLTDLRIRQNYALSLKNKKKLKWDLFVPAQIKNTSPYLNHIISTFEHKLLHSVGGESLQQELKNINAFQLLALIFERLATGLNMKYEEAIQKYYITTIRENFDYDFFNDYKITILEALANCHENTNPSLLILRGSDANTLLFLLPQSKKNCKLFIISEKESNSYLKDILRQLQNFINAHNADIKINYEKSLEYKLDYNSKYLPVMIDVINSAFSHVIYDEDFKNFVIDELQYQDSQNIERMDNQVVTSLHTIATLKRNLLKDPQSRLYEFYEQPEFNNNPSSVARHILKQFANYEASFYDFFGYDVSKRRLNLVHKIISDENNLKLLQDYQVNIDAIKQSEEQGKLHQDLQVGLFIDKLIEVSGYKLSEVEKFLDPSFMKIVKASHNEFARSKLFATQSDLKPIIKKAEICLVNALFCILESKKDFDIIINDKVNGWLTEQHDIISSFAGKEVKDILSKSILQILYKWKGNIAACVDEFLLKTRTKLPKSVKIKGFDPAKSGQLVEFICYDKAAAQSDTTDTEKIYEHYVKILHQIKTVFKKAHDNYFDERIIQIQARRILSILSDYKTPALLDKNKLRNVFNRILILFEDEEIEKAFAEYINKITKTTADGKKDWMISPKSLLKNDDFIKFLVHLYEISDFQNSKIKLNIRLRRLIKNNIS